MTQHASPDEDYYDHLPDGTILGKIPFDEPEKLIALYQERMTPENFEIFVRKYLTLARQKYPELIEELAQQQA
jgi:hypothetical protein